ARYPRGDGDRRRPGAARRDPARLPLVRDGPRHLAHPGPHDHHAEKAARVGDRRLGRLPGGQAVAEPGRARVRGRHVGGARARARARAADRCRPAVGLAHGDSVPAAVAGLSAPDTLERLERTMATLEGMERYEGHLLNWYDTTTLAPLPPRYVSTVDSGNLVGSLMAVAQGVRHLGTAPSPDSVRAAVADFT